MATKKAPTEEQAIPGIGDVELDQAIDDLRGVLKSDAAGAAPLSDFGMDFADTTETTTDFSAGFDTSSSDLGGFGGDFGSDLSSSAASSSFGDDSFGASSFDTGTSTAPGSGMTSNLDLIMDIPIDVQVVLGSSRMQVSGLMNLSEGATIALDRRIGEPVDVVVNGRLIGRGEITVLDEDETRFGVKLIEIKSNKKV